MNRDHIQFAPLNREDCIEYVKRLPAEELLMSESVLKFILERLQVCRDPEGNMLRMLNEVRGDRPTSKIG
jgi:hypothetical protein